MSNVDIKLPPVILNWTTYEYCMRRVAYLASKAGFDVEYMGGAKEGSYRLPHAICIEEPAKSNVPEIAEIVNKTFIPHLPKDGNWIVCAIKKNKALIVGIGIKH